MSNNLIREIQLNNDVYEISAKWENITNIPKNIIEATGKFKQPFINILTYQIEDNDMTPEKAFYNAQSIQQAIIDNDAVIFPEGKYYTSEVLLNNLSNKIIIFSPGAEVIYEQYDDDSGVKRNSCFKFKDCNHITIIGGKINGNFTSEFGLVFNDVQYLYLQNIQIENVGNMTKDNATGVFCVGNCSYSQLNNIEINNVVAGEPDATGYIFASGIKFASANGRYSDHVEINSPFINNIGYAIDSEKQFIYNQNNELQNYITVYLGADSQYYSVPSNTEGHYACKKDIYKGSINSTTKTAQAKIDGDGISLGQKEAAINGSFEGVESMLGKFIIRNPVIKNCSKRAIKIIAKCCQIVGGIIDVNSWMPAIEVQMFRDSFLKDLYIKNGTYTPLGVTSGDGIMLIENCKIIGGGIDLSKGGISLGVRSLGKLEGSEKLTINGCYFDNINYPILLDCENNTSRYRLAEIIEIKNCIIDSFGIENAIKINNHFQNINNLKINNITFLNGHTEKEIFQYNKEKFNIDDESWEQTNHQLVWIDPLVEPKKSFELNLPAVKDQQVKYYQKNLWKSCSLIKIDNITYNNHSIQNEIIPKFNAISFNNNTTYENLSTDPSVHPNQTYFKMLDDKQEPFWIDNSGFDLSFSFQPNIRPLADSLYFIYKINNPFQVMAGQKIEVDVSNVVFSDGLALTQQQQDGQTIEVENQKNVLENIELRLRVSIGSSTSQIVLNPVTKILENKKYFFISQQDATIEGVILFLSKKADYITSSQDNTAKFNIKIIQQPQISILKNSQGIQVENYGAIGDGETDDINAIQEAINDSIKSGLPINFKAEKTYCISKPLKIEIPQNTRKNNLIFDFCGACIKAIKVEEKSLPYMIYFNNQEDLQQTIFKNITLLGTNESAYSGLYIEKAVNGIFENISIYDVRKGISAHKGSNCIFSNCLFERKTDVSIKADNWIDIINSDVKLDTIVKYKFSPTAEIFKWQEDSGKYVAITANSIESSNLNRDLDIPIVDILTSDTNQIGEYQYIAKTDLTNIDYKLYKKIQNNDQTVPTNLDSWEKIDALNLYHYTDGRYEPLNDNQIGYPKGYLVINYEEEQNTNNLYLQRNIIINIYESLKNNNIDLITNSASWKKIVQKIIPIQSFIFPYRTYPTNIIIKYYPIYKCLKNHTSASNITVLNSQLWEKVIDYKIIYELIKTPIAYWKVNQQYKTDDYVFATTPQYFKNNSLNNNINIPGAEGSSWELQTNLSTLDKENSILWSPAAFFKGSLVKKNIEMNDKDIYISLTDFNTADFTDSLQWEKIDNNIYELFYLNQSLWDSDDVHSRDQEGITYIHNNLLNMHMASCIGIDCGLNDSIIKDCVIKNYLIGIKNRGSNIKNQNCQVQNKEIPKQQISSVCCFYSDETGLYTNCNSEGFHIGFYVNPNATVHLNNCIFTNATLETGNNNLLDYCFYTSPKIENGNIISQADGSNIFCSNIKAYGAGTNLNNLRPLAWINTSNKTVNDINTIGFSVLNYMNSDLQAGEQFNIITQKENLKINKQVPFDILENDYLSLGTDINKEKLIEAFQSDDTIIPIVPLMSNVSIKNKNCLCFYLKYQYQNIQNNNVNVAFNIYNNEELVQSKIIKQENDLEEVEFIYVLNCQDLLKQNIKNISVNLTFSQLEEDVELNDFIFSIKDLFAFEPESLPPKYFLELDTKYYERIENFFLTIINMEEFQENNDTIFIPLDLSSNVRYKATEFKIDFCASAATIDYDINYDSFGYPKIFASDPSISPDNIQDNNRATAIISTPSNLKSRIIDIIEVGNKSIFTISKGGINIQPGYYQIKPLIFSPIDGDVIIYLTPLNSNIEQESLATTNFKISSSFLGCDTPLIQNGEIIKTYQNGEIYLIALNSDGILPTVYYNLQAI